MDLRFFFDVIVLSETWHSENDGSTYSIPKYDSFFNYRKINQNDGVAIFTRSGLEARVTPISIPGGNASSISFTFARELHNVIAVYRPPSQQISTFIAGLETYLDNLQQYDTLTITGDINIDIMDETPSTDTHNYLNLLTSKGLLSAINAYTRIDNGTKSCLDHFFTSDPTRATGHVLQTSITDHYMTVLTLHYNNRPRALDSNRVKALNDD